MPVCSFGQIEATFLEIGRTPTIALGCTGRRIHDATLIQPVGTRPPTNWIKSHTGGGQEVFFSLGHVVSDGPWPGSRTRLIDDTNLDPYLFEAIDRKTNQPIYSHGFASIYGEWETTDEPKQGLHRSFHESIRFPWPNGQVQVVIKKRDDDRPYQTSGVRAVKSTISVLPGPSGLGKGYLQEFHRSPFRFLAAPVVLRRRLHVGVPRQFLDRHDVGPGVQQVRDERPPQIVRCERGDLCLRRSTTEQQEHGLIGHASIDERSAPAVSGPEQRAGLVPARRQPYVEGQLRHVGHIAEPVFLALA